MLNTSTFPRLRGRGGAGGSASVVAGNTPYRYWSIQMVGSGLAARTALAQLVATFSDTASPTITASETKAGTDVDNLSDGVQTTYWATDDDYTDAYIYLDLGEGNALTLTSVSLQQTDEVDGDDAHPAALILAGSSVGGTDPDDYEHYCVLSTIVSGVSSDLVEYSVSTAAQNGDDFFLASTNTVWGFIVKSAGTAEKMADVQWQDSGGSALGTVDSHYTKSAAITPADLYDDDSGTETGFEVKTQPQMLATLFTAAIEPAQLELTGAADETDSWTNFFIIAGPDDGCWQIITEVERTWTDTEPVVVIDPKKPKDVRDNAAIHHLPGDWTAAQWNDSISTRHLVQATGANQPTTSTGPVELQFVNTGGSTEYMTADYTTVSVRSMVAVFRRTSANWEGQTDASGAPAADEIKVSGGAGGVTTLGHFDGFLFDSREDFYTETDGWGVDPEADSIPQGDWCGMIATASSASLQNNHDFATFGAGYGSVNGAMLLFLGDVDVSKNGKWKQLQKYVQRVISEITA